MAKAEIQFPQVSDLETVHAFARELDFYSAHDQLTIDFGEKHFWPPYVMLLLSAKLRHLRKRNPNLHFLTKGVHDHSYPAHMGFFRMFGVDHGRDVGEAVGNENYLPITCLRREEFYEAPMDQFRELPDLIQRHADKLATMITRGAGENKDMYDVLSYSIREVMRNVFEHSESNELFYCAQYWPKSNKVEFAVADFGVGIRRGLGENPNFRFALDKDAIEYSLLPSVSGKTHLPRRSETWFNSGYGLYMTSRLARNGGNFVIASGQKAVHLSRKTKNNYDTSFPGTALRFNMDVDQIGSVQARLNEFREEGGQIAKTIAGSGNRPPSAMSLLLRRDYSTR